jgi:hypothetical protein
MAVRSGLIDPFDSVDELQSLVGKCEPVSRFEADDLVPKVQKLLSIGIDRNALSIERLNVCVRVIEKDRQKIQDEVQRLGLSDGIQLIFA